MRWVWLWVFFGLLNLVTLPWADHWLDSLTIGVLALILAGSEYTIVQLKRRLGA